MPNVCPECGARVAEDAERCDLCGYSFHDSADEPSAPETSAPETSEEPPAPATAPDSSERGVFCNQCGWQNPPGAKFCSQCGARLQTAAVPGATPVETAASADAAGGQRTPKRPPIESTAPTQENDSDVGKYVAGIVGTGILLVVALFLITVVSKNDPVAQAPQQGGAPAATLQQAPEPEPLAPQVAEQAAALEDEIEALEGADKLGKQRELVSLYLQYGRFDRAAEVQEAIAQTTNTELDWTQAGNFYYDWMDQREGPDRSFFAKEAIEAYQQALELNPDNLDVRTDMAIAYMYDPENPMEAIRQTNLVLEKEPNHVQANFNRGIMLLQINRLEQAAEQFEKVQTIIGDPSSPVYQRATEVLDTIADLQQRSDT